jgi:hypothetical protein
VTTPLLGLSEIAEGVVNQATIHNTGLRQLEARGFRVLSMTTTTPAVGAAEGDSYIIPAGATGVWSAKTNQMASWIGGAWSYYTPIEGVGGIWVNDLDTAYSFDGSAWVASGGVGASAPFSDATAIVKGSTDATKKIRFEVDGLTTATTRAITVPDKNGTMAMMDDLATAQVAIDLSPQIKATEHISIACSDETTALAAGANKVTFRMPYAFTLTAIRASLSTTQTSGSIFTVDVNEGGTTILSTKLTIDNTEKTTTTAVTAAVISDASLADDAEITVDIDQIGDGTAKGLKVYLIGTRT